MSIEDYIVKNVSVNKKLLFQVGQPTDNDNLEFTLKCYELYGQPGKDVHKEMNTCVEKWRNAYQYVASSDFYESYMKKISSQSQK